MRKLSLLCSLIVSALFVVGCGGDNTGGTDKPTPGTTPEISLEQNAVDFNSFTFDVTSNVAGELGYAVVAEGYTTPTMTEWFNANKADVAAGKQTITIDGLKDNTNYTLYAVLRAKADGVLSAPKNIKFTTPDDGKVSPISVDYVGYDTIRFTINVQGSYVFQCIDKAYVEYMNQTPESYIQTPGIGIPSSGPQEVEWVDGGKYGNFDMRVREDSDYYILVAITNGNEITDQVYVEETRTPKKPNSEYGVTTELKNITSTSVTINTVPERGITQYYVYVRDKAWVDSIIAGYGESMLASLVKNPNAGAWVLNADNEQTWGGLTPATDYNCMILVVDNAGAESLSVLEFKTAEASGKAPEVDASLTEANEDGYKTLALNLLSSDAAYVKVAFNTSADVAALRAQGYDDSCIALNYGMDLSEQQVSAVRTTGLSLAMEDLFPEVEYEAVVSVKNAEKTETIVAYKATTAKKPVPARVESNLFTTLQGEWEVSYDLIQYNFNEVSISNAPVTIAQGVDATTEKLYRDHNRLVILGWPFNVGAWGEHEAIPVVTPAELKEADPGYWGAYANIAYRDYGPKIFLEIGADGSVVVPSSRSEYLYNWSEDGTFYFFGCDVDNEFTAPASFPVTVSADGNTITIGICNSGEEFGYGNYRPAVFRGNDVWAIATSDIVLKRK